MEIHSNRKQACAQTVTTAVSTKSESSKRTTSELDLSSSELSGPAKKVFKSHETAEQKDIVPCLQQYQTLQEQKAVREARALEKLKEKIKRSKIISMIGLHQSLNPSVKRVINFNAFIPNNDDTDEDKELGNVEKEEYAESVESWDLQDSDNNDDFEESQETIKGVELHDDCWRHVFLFLTTKERLIVHRVNRQFKRVAEQFESLKIQDFYLSRKRWPGLTTALIDYTTVNWEAFIRALARSGGSVRNLDISAALMNHHFGELQAAIDEGACDGVRRIVVCSRRLSKRPSALAGELKYELEPMAEVCARLPRLQCLVIRECVDINTATLRSLKEHVLPRIHELEISWGIDNGYHFRKPKAGEKAWEKFFERMPDELSHLTMSVFGSDCDFLQFLVQRLRRGLKKLRALHLSLNMNGNTWIMEFLAASLLKDALDLLNNQLTEFTIRTKGERMSRTMAHWSEMTALQKLGLYMSNMDSTYRDILNLGHMRNLRELHITCNSIPPDEVLPDEVLYAPLSQLPGLETLEFPLDVAHHPQVLDHISLPGLTNLTLNPTPSNITRFSRLHLIIPSLARLVGRCPRLDVLNLATLWRMTKIQHWWMSVELLSEIEISLLRSRVAPRSNSQALPEASVDAEGSMCLETQAGASDSQTLPETSVDAEGSTEMGSSSLGSQSTPCSDSQALPGSCADAEGSTVTGSTSLMSHQAGKGDSHSRETCSSDSDTDDEFGRSISQAGPSGSGLPQALLQPTPVYSQQQTMKSISAENIKEKMKSAVIDVLREREKRLRDEMVRPLHVKLGRYKMKNKNIAEKKLKCKCILEERYIHSVFTDISPVLCTSVIRTPNP